MSAPDNKALVYIVRTSALGWQTEIEVFVNDKYIGTTGGSRYIYTILDPGKYVFKSAAENDSELILEVDAGKTYYLKQDISMGYLFGPRNELILLNETEGRSDLQECTLSAKCTILSEK